MITQRLIHADVSNKPAKPLQKNKLLRKQAIILDLDDTIFPTKSMRSNIFLPFFEDLTASLKNHFDSNLVENIVEELWERPIDNVFKRHNVEYEMVSSSFEFFNTLDISLDIKTYPDYKFFNSCKIPKYLVTKGIKSLQLAKIKALGIEKDFDEICIIDTLTDTKPKNIIFRQIKQAHKLVPANMLVVGDNPDSEIESGNIEQMVTVQILRENVKKGNNADHYIKSFYELVDIIGRNHE